MLPRQVSNSSSGREGMKYSIGDAVVFDAENAEIINLLTAESVAVDPLSAKVLAHLIEQKHKFNSNDELAKHWVSNRVSDASVSRVISNLRRDLKTINIHWLVIKNKSKTGYKLCILPEPPEFEHSGLVQPQERAVAESRPVEYLNRETPPIANNKHGLLTVSKARIRLFGTLCLAAGFVIAYVTLVNSIVGAAEINVNLWAESKGIADFKENPSKTKYALAKRDVTGQWFIVIKDLNKDEQEVIQQQSWHNLTPVWLTDSSLLFQSRNGQGCFFKLATTGAGGNARQTIGSCPVDKAIPAMTKLSEHQVAFVSTNEDGTSPTLFTLSIPVGLVEHQPLRLDDSQVPYYLTLDKPSGLLAILSSETPSGPSTLELFDSRDHWRRVFQYHFSRHLYKLSASQLAP